MSREIKIKKIQKNTMSLHLQFVFKSKVKVRVTFSVVGVDKHFYSAV